MLPYKYRHNKISAILFRNVSTSNKKFYFEVVDESNQIEVFRSTETELCLVSAFIQLSRILTLKYKRKAKTSSKSSNPCIIVWLVLLKFKVDINFKLRSEDNPDFKFDFEVDL